MSHKVMDKKNRWRSKTVSFRVSPEEWADIERLVRLSGMSKQDYIMHRLQNKQINVTANPRVVKAIKSELQEICNTIKEHKFDVSACEILREVLKIVN